MIYCGNHLKKERWIYLSPKDRDKRVFVDSAEYLAKKAAFDRLTTIYGRNAVHEALTQHPQPKVVTLLLAEELPSEVSSEFRRLAKSKGVAIKTLPAQKLSRITKRQDEDQGVAADLDIQLITPLADWLKEAPRQARLLAVIGVTTPANIGIIARSVAGAGLTGLIIPEKGCPTPTLPLIIKASAGHIFKTKIYSVPEADDLPKLAKQAGFSLLAMTSTVGSNDFYQHKIPEKGIYMLGNESLGLPPELIRKADQNLHIPLAAGVDSLNVAAAATLVAFHVR